MRPLLFVPPLSSISFLVQESAKAINSQDRNDLTWRERRHVEAMERKLVNDEKAAVDIWEDILLKFPRGTIR